MNQRISVEHFRFSPDILRRLGEELVPDVEQGILELVKNAYDADASVCRVALHQAEDGPGSLVISDDGIGMNAESVVNGWLLLGRSSKVSAERTAMGRLPIGNKGLGRLAALRLGSLVTLTTRPASSPGTEFRVNIDWDAFEKVESVEEVPIDIESRLMSPDPPGTIIEIKNLQRRIGFREVQRLARGLLLFSDPFSHHHEFRPTLEAPEFRDLERLVGVGYFDEAEYHLIASLDSEGRAAARVEDYNGNTLWETGPKDSFAAQKYQAPESEFQLWAFLLGGRKFANRAVPVSELTNWLRHVGGVHVYRRNVRVSPYGSTDDDWTSMNLARARSPEERPSTNNSLGFVKTDDPSDRLLEKTDRTGFVQNQAFEDLRRFCRDALDWMATRRLAHRERQRTKTRTSAPASVVRAQQLLEERVQRLPSEYRSTVKADVEKLVQAHSKERISLTEEVQLYRTIASVGTFTAAFAHETRKPIDRIASMLKSIEARGAKSFGVEFKTVMARPMQVAVAATYSLRNFVAVPLRLLQRERRRRGRVEINAAVRSAFELFEWHLTQDDISFELNLSSEPAYILGSEAAIDSVISNFITNSINSMNSADAKGRPRRMRVTTSTTPLVVRIQFTDSGPGIRGISLDSIWLPGRTTTDSGTGIGLTIVKDTVEDLGGVCAVSATSDLGGAQFEVELPLVETK